MWLSIGRPMRNGPPVSSICWSADLDRPSWPWHTIANFYYLVAPTRGGRPTRDFVLDLLRFAEAAPATTEARRRATRLQMRDFEGAMQVVAAEACGADVIATRNIRGYARSPLRAATPKALIRELL
jgi:hypothetical protein